jgi:hypothetical protein
MKKSALIALFGLASVAAFGQGYVSFDNYYSSNQTTGITYGNGPAAGLGAGPEISVELMYGNSTDTAISELTLLSGSITAVGLGLSGVTGPGAFSSYNGGYTGTGAFAEGNVLIPGTPGTTYAFAIYAFGTYTGGPGGNGNYFGYSSIVTGPSQGSGPPLPTVPEIPYGLQTANIFVSETIVPAPEPSSLALAGLGGFGMLMAFRRKKA